MVKRVPAMPDWTKKNFENLRDVSPPDVQIQWRFARQALKSPKLGVSRFTYEPGARMPWGHRHREQEEVYVVVAGSGGPNSTTTSSSFSAWDVLRVAPAFIRSFEAGADGLDVLVHRRSQARGRADTERFDDFWA